MTRLLEEAFNRMDTNQDYLSVRGVAWNPLKNVPASITGLRQMIVIAVTQLTDELNARIIQVTKESQMVLIKNFDDEHKMTFVQIFLRKATGSMATSMLKHDDV